MNEAKRPKVLTVVRGGVAENLIEGDVDEMTLDFDDLENPSSMVVLGESWRGLVSRTQLDTEDPHERIAFVPDEVVHLVRSCEVWMADCGDADEANGMYGTVRTFAAYVPGLEEIRIPFNEDCPYVEGEEAWLVRVDLRSTRLEHVSSNTIVHPAQPIGPRDGASGFTLLRQDGNLVIQLKEAGITDLQSLALPDSAAPPEPVKAPFPRNREA